MKFKKPSQLMVGMAVLLTTFGFSLWQVFGTNREERGVTLLRFAHWQLESGAEQGLDAVIRAYEKRHPGVRIEQMRIPERVYANWLTTQLVGGTAPDMIQLDYRKLDPPRLALYFDPITHAVMQPNPYNAGTPLEKLAWRDTYLDGMEGGFSQELQDYYGAPLFMTTTRVFYNVDLLRRITGDAQPPRSYAEMIELGRKVRQYARREGQGLTLVAGSRYHGSVLTNAVFRTATQRLAMDLSMQHLYIPDNEEVLLAYLQGGWTFGHPAVKRGLELMAEVGELMQSGFMQLEREDSTFLFEQQRAVMLMAGTVDATTLRERADFELGIFALPAPDPNYAGMADLVLGPISEDGGRAVGPMGLFRHTKHPDIALDFLRFLTSYEGNRIYSRESGWLPAIRDIPLTPELAPFRPMVAGYPAGFMPRLGADTQRRWDNWEHMLFSPTKGPAAFVAQIEPDFSNDVRQDLLRALSGQRRRLAQQDLIILGLEELATSQPEAGTRAAQQRNRQIGNEISHAFYHAAMERVR